MTAVYISIDEEKARLQGYDPAHAERFQEQSAREANKLFERALKKSACHDVILLSGGSASGKTEFYSEYLNDRDCIVFDSTLPTKAGAEIKIRQIRKASKTPIIYAILPDDIRRSFLAFLGRDRKFSPRYFYRTHAGSRRTLLWIARQYPDVEIRVFESSFSPKNILEFTAFEFANRKQMLEFLKGIQMTQKEIIAILRHL